MPTHLFSKQKIHAKRKVCMDSTFSIGGDKRDRTADLLNAIQALSQLSYTPDSFRLSLEARVILSDGRAFVKGVLEIFLEKSKYSTCHVVKGVFHVAGGAVNAPADLLLLGF